MPSWKKKKCTGWFKNVWLHLFNFMFISWVFCPCTHMHAVLEEARGGHLETLELALAVLSYLVGAGESNLGILEGPPVLLTD